MFGLKLIPMGGKRMGQQARLRQGGMPMVASGGDRNYPRVITPSAWGGGGHLHQSALLGKGPVQAETEHFTALIGKGIHLIEDSQLKAAIKPKTWWVVATTRFPGGANRGGCPP